MRKYTILVAVFALLFFAMPVGVNACWVQPKEFEIWSEDGRLVLRFDPTPRRAVPNYALLTLYEKNDDWEVVYRIRNFPTLAFVSSFHLSYDFRHFVYVRPGCARFYFFSNGVLTKSYHYRSFIRNHNEIQQFSIGPRWIQHTEVSHEENTFTITTVEDRTIVFDITTGAIIYETAEAVINESRNIVSTILSIVGAGLFCIFMLAVLKC